MLPSPIPHPLDHCPWELPGWIYEALDWVVGVEWPESNERAVWDLADQWYCVAGVLAGPRADATSAASEVRSGYGGIGLVAEAFDTAWRRVAEGDEAPLPVLLAVTGELGQLVESCGCDIEGAKIEVWIELGILVVELLSLAVATVLTAGAASPAAGVAITTSRMVVQQIFKRLMTQLARKALKEGAKEASERAAKQVVKSGMRGLARRAALGGLVEAGQEAGVSLATQAYQNSTGRRDGLDVADVGMSAVGGFAGGAVAPLAGLGRHANGRLAEIGEHLGREMTGEVFAEGAAGLVTGQGASLEDLARAAVSGVSGAATGQADTALHHRLDGRMAALAGTTLPLTDLSGTAAFVSGPDAAAPDALGERTPRPAAAVPATAAGPSSEVVSPQSAGPLAAPVVGTLPLNGPAVQGASVPAVPQAASVVSVSVASEPIASPSSPVTVEAEVTPTRSSAAADPRLASTAPTSVDTVPAHVTAALDGSSLRPAVTAEPVAGTHQAPVTAPLPSSGGPAPVPPPMTGGGPLVGSEPPRAGGSDPTPGRSLAGTLAPPAPPTTTSRLGHVATPAAPSQAPVPPAPAPEPSPSPRFPLLEALAPRPPRQADDASPVLPGPFDPLPPRPRTPEQLAAARADREGLDRRRYQGYFEAQRTWFEERRRQEEADWLRASADRRQRSAGEYGTHAQQLEETGRDLLARRWRQAAFDASTMSYELRERAQAVLNGSVVPDEVMVDADADFYRINDDVADLAPGSVETSDRSALTRDDGPPPIDRSRRYGIRGGLRPPLALHQTDLERQVPRNPDGSIMRTADPRHGGWFQLANDGGPQADPTRGINCLDCTLSLYETWMHGRPRVSAPRTFDGYLQGDVCRPVGGEADGPRRVEESTGGRFQNLCPVPGDTSAPAVRQAVEHGYRDLHEQLLLGGHGSYAFLITSYEGGGSHAWVALNQNGSVLYLDPQHGHVWDRPLYTHSGGPNHANVVGVDALVLGRDGHPMPLAGRPPGNFNVLPDPPPRTDPPRTPAPSPAPPETAEDVPDFNHVHLLWESDVSGPPGAAAPAGGRQEPDPGEVRRTHRSAHAERISAGVFVRDGVTASNSIEEVFAAGVTPVELANHLDESALRRLVPGLDDAAARDLTRLFGDPRVQQMLDQTWEAPPSGEPLLAETLVRQLTQHPDLARMMLATPELANSLTARPMTLHHLAIHQQAINVLGEVLDDIAERGPEAVAVEEEPIPRPTPLTAEQRRITAAVAARKQSSLQLGFDASRMDDEGYRLAYVEQLYADAVAAQRELNGIASHLAGDHGRPSWRVQAKDRARVMDKLVEYQNDASRLKDLAAAKVQFGQLDDIYRAVGRLAADPQVLILDIKDRFLSPQLSGYRDVLVNLRISNGHVAELRLHLAALEPVAEWEHALYEVRRDLEAIAEADGRPLTNVERAIRDGLLQRVQDRFWRALGEGL
ncbi:toxin glutamine deamidase domain-containing protein [Micromonospora sp. NBC_00898]|uniref:toxin glutamine deamidase domain-containing protein n=1 Tax=Micromonospora sp. NBC_00898 TaxID=2975981 RepID=UPI0038678E3E|nr:toxin glutamine deamidase domain-containing protein [Micromonospora sp. NBC_00898]